MNKSTDRKAAAIYREAASNAIKRRAGYMKGACLEIRDINTPGGISADDPLAQKFRATFDPGEGYNLLFWQWDADSQRQRVLALCFMAAMVEAGDA